MRFREFEGGVVDGVFGPDFEGGVVDEVPCIRRGVTHPTIRQKLHPPRGGVRRDEGGYIPP